MLFYYQKDGREVGPFIISEFRAKIKSGEISPATLVRPDISPDWLSSKELLESGILEEIPKLREAAFLAAQEARDQEIYPVAFSPQSLSKIPIEGGLLVEKGVEYSRFLMRHFSTDKPPGMCTVYLNTPGEMRALFTWTGKFPQKQKFHRALFVVLVRLSIGRLGHLFMSDDTQDEIISFVTVHDFCRTAARKQKNAWLWSHLAWGFATLLAIAALGLSLWSLLVFITTEGEEFQGAFFEEQLHLLKYILAVAGLCIAASWALFRWAKALRLPPALRMLEKWPFRVTGLAWEDLP